jgi:hypothetical protein
MAMITAMITPRGSASTMTMTLDNIPIPSSIPYQIQSPILSLIPDKIPNTIPIPETQKPNPFPNQILILTPIRITALTQITTSGSSFFFLP